MKNAAIILALLAALTACKTYVTTDIFTRDLIEVYRTGNVLTTPLELAFEIGSSSECEKATAGILPGLIQAYGDAEATGCERRGFDTVVKFRVLAEIVNEVANQKNDSKQPIYIGVFSEKSGQLVIGYFQNGSAIETFIASLPDELGRFGGRDVLPQLAATIQNDLQKDAKIMLLDVFADGKPIPVHETKNYILTRRGQVDIVLSDVSNAAFLAGYSYVQIGVIAIEEGTD